MRFHTPLLLLLAIPWLVVWTLFARRQKVALAWVLTNVSERFRSRFSVHSPRSLRRHLSLLATMGLLLIAGAAGPYLPGTAEVEAERARVVLLFDASASMYATDLETPPGWEDRDGPRWNRFAAAKELAEELILSLPDTSFAVASFSGSVALHSPMSADQTFLLEALRTLEVHGHYQNTGSSLAGALDSIFSFQDETRPNLQALILGDGEQPQPEELGAALGALAAQQVPVHTLAIGSVEGQERRIFDHRDIVAKKQEPAVLQKYHTRRVDTELRRISRATGGIFGVLDGGSPDRLRAAIRSHDSPPARIESRGTGSDLAVFCLLGFLIAFLADGLLIGRRPRHQPLRFDIGRIGRPRAGSARTSGRAAGALVAALALLYFNSCSNTPRSLALRENEQGIAFDALGQREQARVHYKRSIGYGVESQIPAFNLARSIHKEGDYSRAHDLYQEALKIDPSLPEAYYNDGIALFDWGEAERDPKGCQLERAHDLWTQALRRFGKAISLTDPSRSTGRRARENHDHLSDQLAELERLIESPPPECLGGGGGAENEDPSQADQSQAGNGSSGGEGDDQDQGGGGGPGDDGDDQNQGDGSGDDGDDQSHGGDRPGDQGDDPSQSGGGGSSDDQDEQDQPGGGGSPSPGPESPSAGSENPPLSPDELEQIRNELARIGLQALESGKYHRRTLPEQFGKEHWANPDRVIWW